VYRCVKVKPSWGMDMLNTLMDAACFTWCAILAGSVGRIGPVTLVFNIMISYMLIFVFPFRRALIVVPLCYLTYCATSAITFQHDDDTTSLELRSSQWGTVIAELGALGIGLVLSVSAKRMIELSKWEAFVMCREKAAEAIHEKVLRVQSEFAHEVAVRRTRLDSESSAHFKEASGNSRCENILPSLLSAPAILQVASTDNATKACIPHDSSGGDCLPPDAKVWIEGHTCPRLLSQLKCGERILCYDRLSGNLKYAAISAFEQTEGDITWCFVSLADGTTLKMTSDHPIQPHVTGAQNAASGSLAPVRAEDLQPKRDSLTVLKIASVPVDAVQHVKEVGQKISLSVQQPLRHSIFVASHGETANGGAGLLQTMCVESADVLSQNRLRLGESRTFVHLTEDDLSEPPPLRRTLSEPSGFPSCPPEQDVDHGGSAAPRPLSDAPGSFSNSTGSQCPVSSHESSSATGSQNADVLVASALTLAPACQEAGDPGAAGALFAVSSGANAPARLSDLLRLKSSGLRSLGSVDHGSGNCHPCAFHNRYRPNGAVLLCKKGLLCERCHQDHQGTVRQYQRQMARQSRRKPAGIDPAVLIGSQTAAPAAAAASAAAPRLVQL